MYLNKKEKLKQFTISVFVDSFEDYSFNNKSNSDTSSSTINNNESPKDKHNTYQHNGADDVNSLREFELNEARTIISTANSCKTNSHRNQSIINIEHDSEMSIKKPTFQATQIYDDDVFMFQSRPNNFNIWNNASILASKPPLMPTQVESMNKYGNDENANNNNNNANNNNACLSTIIEGSVETFETCSNQSRERLDEVNANNSDIGLENEQNVTIRKDASSKLFKSNDSYGKIDQEKVNTGQNQKSLTEILNVLGDDQEENAKEFNESIDKNEKDSFFGHDNLG